MKTTKAYLAGLGMTGIVVGSMLVLLVVGTGLVAFHGLPGFSTTRDPLERVVADDHAGAAPARREARGERRVGLQPLDGADGHPPAARPPVPEGTQETAPRPAERKRGTSTGRTQGHGGAESWAPERLGGGAGVEIGRAGRGAPGVGGGGGSPSLPRGVLGGGTVLPPAGQNEPGGEFERLDRGVPRDPLR